jgi:hypothetical protein
MGNLIVETRLNMTTSVMSVARKKKLYKVIVLVILISKDNSDWYKEPATWVRARKVSRAYEEQRGKWKICGFSQWIYYNMFFFIWMFVWIEWN